MWCFGSMRMFMDKCDEFQAWKLAQDIVWEKHNGSSFHADRFRRVHESIVQFYPNGHCWEQIIHNTPHTHDAVKKTVRRKVRPPHMGHIDDGVYTSEDGGPRIMRSVRFVHSTHGYAIHPTQKPVAIILPLLQYSCLPDSVVVDPFGGSLSTLKACLELGLKGIAIEKDQAIIERGLANLYPRMFQPVS
jgi:site-specific DNA-methyltransferase (adenine-specific)